MKGCSVFISSFLQPQMIHSSTPDISLLKVVLELFSEAQHFVLIIDKHFESSQQMQQCLHEFQYAQAHAQVQVRGVSIRVYTCLLLVCIYVIYFLFCCMYTLLFRLPTTVEFLFHTAEMTSQTNNYKIKKKLPLISR